MILSVRLISRVAVFSALVFAGSYMAVWIPNVNPCFFIIFTAGFVWGAWAGITVGVIGFFLWAILNPYGPSPPFLLLSQLVGISFSGLIGAITAGVLRPCRWSFKTAIILAIAGFGSGLCYHLAVDSVDALIYQPFWPRLIGGLVFSLITVLSNTIMFPVLYPVLAFLAKRENRRD